ncbi:VUT family protein [Streptomyces sp. PKU-MA01144]|uniref:VUT family protein n=1 Tax=Streptomyces sp. PKU-MA01144 TaxID=2729138 RepID=UPI00147F0F49|nr:VUT family protein [Streptomyces sp. PKU-MA01144]NNJ04174.1 VUT family protein [Streptomyces sp. PKU-MA01144]
MNHLGTAALTAYATSITAANILTARYGLVPVAPGMLTTAGTFAAGAALLLRDVVQDTLGRAAVFAGIAAGAALTWATSPALAVASATAFLAAELADMAVYTPLRNRGWARAVLASNAVGAVVDTLLFLLLAGFPLTAAAVGGQLVGKLAWATLLPVAAVLTVRRWRRAVPRHSLGT